MSSTQKYACRSVFTEVGGAARGGGAVLVAQPPSVVADEDDSSVDAGADMEQAVIRTAAQRALIMAASVA
ncbi:hypothetical protein MF672_050885 (plasmid) [Actinomadura sp. ATCC 31491]|uniref:Uncharacterized protein n=1 Tax=Actinomadura luzonensis TaxID=2805427 RepID=A0ABT0GD97_9ACTN|nr:hypothetical protein [Actinomadura luzonensis]MCK2222061.1 hypothetical protein [Actinomadura luzonensis]